MTANSGGGGHAPSPASPRPAAHPSPPPQPLIAPTGSPGVNCVVDVINSTAAPFMNAPPAEQGAAGYVAQGLGGVMGLIGAPQQIIDTGFAALTAPIAAMFPAMPAVTLLGMHVAPPHTHTHPPSLIPPAPPVPLPSLGMLVGSGSVTVLVGGLPAARAGDIGLAVTCGSLAPPFEVYTGSSNVFLGGSRAARILDLTKHCNPTSMGPVAVAMGAAGVAAGAAGAIASGSGWAAAQAAADAAVLAIKMLVGKDPGLPPGMGVLVGPPVPNVLIGGFPCPPIGEMAVGGLMKALSAMRRAVRNLRSSRRGNAHCANGTHPIYLPTGENFDEFKDFVSEGLFVWRRHYTTARHRIDSPFGYGYRHFYQRELRVRLHQATYVDWDGVEIRFPRFESGADTTRSNGYVLRRIRRGRYQLSYRRQPTMEFSGGEFDGDLRLVRMFDEGRELEIEHDELGRIAAFVDRRWEPRAQTRYELRYDRDGHVTQLLEMPAGASFAAGSADRAVVRAAYGYDRKGQLIETQDAGGGRWKLEYDWFHRLTKQVDPRGYTYTFKYDTGGRCVWASGEDGLWWAEVQYFPEKKYTRYTEGENATYEYHYDEDGFVHTIIDPYGGKVCRERDLEGKIVREVDSGGRALHWLYDDDGCHYARVDRFGYVYPPQLEMPKLPNPFVRQLANTALARLYAGLVESAPRASGSLLDVVPQPLGGMLHATFQARRPAAVQKSVARDALGRTVREADDLGRVREWSYDASGNVIAIHDRDRRVTEQRTTSWNLLGEKRDALGHSLQYRYSKLEQIIAIADPLGNVSRYDYDLKERLVRVHRNGRVREEYVFDLGDHFVEKKDGAGRTLFRNELHDNHFVAKRVLASGGFHRFDYDARGRIVEASTERYEVKRAFDTFGRLLADERDGEGVLHRYVGATQRTRVLGRFAMSAETHRDGTTVLVGPGGAQTVLRFDTSGAVLRQCGNGTTELSHYDDEGRLEARFAFKRLADGSWQSWAARYSYTAEGDLVRIADSARGTTVYEVDAAHRLIAETTPDGRRLTYELDAAGNVVSKPGLRRVEITSGNRLVSTDVEQFEFDERDHLAVRRGRDGSVTRYTYDSFDMLVRLERWGADGTPEPTFEYDHDALGRRLSVRAGAYAREFYWDGDRLGAEVLPNGRLRIYEYASRDALVPLGFTEYASVDAAPETACSFSVYSDQVGMPLHVEDDGGQIVWWASRIDPYGLIEVHPSSQIEYNLRWPGHYFDPETLLHSNRYRVYDPVLGRYLQSDPAGYAGSEINLYAYAPNPLTTVDLFGLDHDARTPRANSDSAAGADGSESPRRVPDTGGDSDAPPRRPGEAVGPDGLTDAQRAHFRARIDGAPDADAAAQARYDRNCAKRDNAGQPHMDPADWQQSHDRLRSNSERGTRLENQTLADAGVPNNNHGDPPQTHPTPSGAETRPDGVTPNSVVDVKSMPDTPHDDGSPRVLYDSDQLQGQRNMADASGREPVVIMTNGDSSAVRPSGPLAEGSTIYHRDSNTGQWSSWTPATDTSPAGWTPCPRPNL